MLISEFDYELPQELIAQEPLPSRTDSRMLVVNRSQQNWHDAKFQNFPELINSGDVVVLNNTRVFPARLIGNRENLAGKVELFLVRELENKIWETLARPLRRLSEGTNLVFGGGKLKAKVLQKQLDGRLIVDFEADGDFAELLETVGQTPLPPYIRRQDKPTAKDYERYQTVFAKEKGAIAAPTAGLHFTPEILEQVKGRGAEIVEITLHVGYGTFEPVRAADLSAHAVAPEQSEIGIEAADALNRAKGDKRRILSVGTTTTRALESATSENGEIQAGACQSALTITPGYNFKTVDALLTNFHLPQSSLLILVSTFTGHKLIMSAYAHAVAAKYRFYSYGDCMLIT
jgi:S-adenosylmethionine:tRNA ribosyltransferase-isomerase